MGIDAPRALRQLRAEELRQLCKEQGLNSQGRKGDLIQRLADFRAGHEGDEPQRSPPKPVATPGRGRGRGRGRATVKTSPSLTKGLPAAPSLLRRPNLLGGGGVSLWAASRQQLMRCCRCQALADLGHARYSGSPDAFWCPICRFKVMDPFNAVVDGNGVLKHLLVMEPHFDFTLELPDLRLWRRQGLGLEVRMLKVDSCKVEQVWPRQIHFFANGAEVFAVHPPEEGHKRRDVPMNISAGLKAGLNDIKVRMVDDDCVGFAMVVLLTSSQPAEALMAQVPRSEAPLARRRVCELLARQAANTRAGDAGEEELVCLSSDTLKLQCPITMERVQDPVRGERCQHTQCFSLEAYVMSNRQMGAFNRRWLCPLCSLILRPPDLRRDSYVAKILDSTPESVDEVIVAADGSWRPRDGLASQGSEGVALASLVDAVDAVETVDAVEEPCEPVDLDPTPKTPTTPRQSEPGADAGAGAGAVVSLETGSTAGPESCTGSEANGRGRRIRLSNSSPAAPATGTAGIAPEGYGLAVAVSMVGGLTSVSSAARQRRLAQLELQDDDSSPSTKKAAKRRLDGPSKRARKETEVQASLVPVTAPGERKQIDLD